MAKVIDWLISKLPEPLFSHAILLLIVFNPKARDIIDNSNITIQDGKTVITRPDGHIFIDSRGIVTVEKKLV